MRGRNRIGNGVDEMRSQRTGFRQMVDSPAFVETGHLDRIFHRRSFTVDAQRSLAVLSNGDDATVNLRRELTVYRYLLVTSRLSLRQRRIVEIRKTDGALDLERAFTFEKNRRCMGIDPANMRMGGGTVRKAKMRSWTRASAGMEGSTAIEVALSGITGWRTAAPEICPVRSFAMTALASTSGNAAVCVRMPA